MDPNPWDILLGRQFSGSTAITLLLYTSAAEKLAEPDYLLETLVVVWMWQLKQEFSPYHEFFVIETVDPNDGNKIRRFILERVLHQDRTEVRPTTSASKD
jgi:hypothetical protein